MPDIAPLPPLAPPPAPAGVAVSAPNATPATPPVAPAVPLHPEALRQQLAALAPPAPTHLRFHVEDGCIAVSVIDERSGEVLMQVPSEAALRIARRLHAGGSLVDDHA